VSGRLESSRQTRRSRRYPNETENPRLDSRIPGFQFGVRSRSGVEPILRCIELASQRRVDAGFTSITWLDFSNAFNSVSRDDIANGINTFAPDFLNAARCAYGIESDHFIRTEEGAPIVIKSSSGVKQGDPFGPQFFPSLFAPFFTNFLFTSDRITSSSPTWTTSSSWAREEARRNKSTLSFLTGVHHYR